MKWYVYIVICRDGTYYTGITNNLKERIKTHNRGKGARYTAQRIPVQLVWCEEFPNQSQARKREIEVKDWRREKKIMLIEDSSSKLLLTTLFIPKNVSSRPLRGSK